MVTALTQKHSGWCLLRPVRADQLASYVCLFVCISVLYVYLDVYFVCVCVCVCVYIYFVFVYISAVCDVELQFPWGSLPKRLMKWFKSKLNQENHCNWNCRFSYDRSNIFLTLHPNTSSSIHSPLYIYPHLPQVKECFQLDSPLFFRGLGHPCNYFIGCRTTTNMYHLSVLAHR